MYNGISYHNLDGKGRLSVPSRFRGEDSGAVQRFMVLRGAGGNYLEVYPFAHWEKIVNKLNALPQFEPKIQAVRRHFIGSAADCECDRQGRILLPPVPRQVVADGEVALVGVGLCFEIWSKELWLAEQERIAADMENLGAAIAELGI
jgi:MraZ protein